MISSFMALGDSFTEGLNDTTSDGAMIGWADRFAALLARQNGGVRYANLAIRGRLLDQIVEEQLPAALEQKPDVVGFSAGGNDILRPGANPDAVAARYEAAVVRLRAAGSRVLVFTGMDFGGTPVLRLVRGKVATYNEHLRAIAERNGCDVVDLWGLTPLSDRRAYSPDRLHLSAAGHERVARLVASVLGVEAGDPFEPIDAPHFAATAARGEDVQWAREHFLPWVGRRIRHQSSGDGIVAKRPRLELLELLELDRPNAAGSSGSPPAH